jgi:hypothetical protein
MTTLHRAIVSSSHHNAELVVFFEVHGWAGPVYAHLEATLARLWNVQHDDLDIYNVHSESELKTEAFGDASTGDSRLFEVGFCDGRVVYAKRATTQFLVSPPTLARLLAAQQGLPHQANVAQHAAPELDFNV